MLPTKKLKNAFKLSWKALFSIFEGHALSGLPQDTRTLSVADMTRYYSLCFDQLKGIASYCFTAPKQPHSWSISTWAMRTRRSSVLKNGTDQDRVNLPPETFRNRTNRTTVRAKRQSLLTLYPHRQNRGVEEEPALPVTDRSDENEEEDEVSITTNTNNLDI